MGAEVSAVICPKCEEPADLVENPPRYTLPKHRGVCRSCGHEWQIRGEADVKRYTQ